ncbi:hypothetical protein H7171_03480 [Candidatus Saccharibacteria bacterium]|nr:hypothetical protein [Candidatus Saccharibacteria bacterium]
MPEPKSRLAHIFTSVKLKVIAKLIEPKKYVKYLGNGEERVRYDRYMHNWLLIDAAALLLLWIVVAINGATSTSNLLLVLAVGTLLCAMPYTLRQFNSRRRHLR